MGDVVVYRATQRLHPANLREGDVLCGEDGRPYGVVLLHPVADPVSGSVWLEVGQSWGSETVKFAPGTSALILARTATSNER